MITLFPVQFLRMCSATYVNPSPPTTPHFLSDSSSTCLFLLVQTYGSACLIYIQTFIVKCSFFFIFATFHSSFSLLFFLSSFHHPLFFLLLLLLPQSRFFLFFFINKRVLKKKKRRILILSFFCPSHFLFHSNFVIYPLNT